MLKFDYGKYRGILISVLLFLLLDASVLILNFYISFQIADDAVGVNLAGRQRMLSQRMTKALFVMNGAQPESEVYSNALRELDVSSDLFHTTLNAFFYGGNTQSAGDENVYLFPVEHSQGRVAMNEALTIWAPYRSAIGEFLKNRDENSLSLALSVAEKSNIPLLKLMNDLTNSLENVASSKAKTLRTIQTIGISLALVNFFIIMFHFVRQLRESDAVIESARKETTEILETVNEGLFLIDEKLIIGNQHSLCLGAMLGTNNIAGKSFQQVLENIVSEKDAETAEGFINLLFNPKIKEKLIGDLNPLQSVEINVQKKEGTFSTKTLSFSFARAYEQNTISHVLVTVIDITEKVKLEKELEESKRQSENQIEMLTSLLHANPSLIKEFIKNTYSFFTEANNILKSSSKSDYSLKEKARTLFREVHKFKGESAALGLDFYEESAHIMENTLEQILEVQKPSGNDFLPFAVQLESLMGYNTQIENLSEKLAKFSSSMNQGDNSCKTEELNMEQYFKAFTSKLASRNGKNVELRWRGAGEISISSRENEVRDICIQLIRNAMVHGIETPADRKSSGKQLHGSIVIKTSKNTDDFIEIQVEDDGQGIDYEAIRNKAKASHLWQNNEIAHWDNRKLLAVMFKDGLSTLDEAGKDAGRGVGLSAVANIVNRLGGKISVATKAGHFTRFTVRIPEVTHHQKERYLDAVANDC